jgi:hypothetical protein
MAAAAAEAAAGAVGRKVRMARGKASARWPVSWESR